MPHRAVSPYAKTVYKHNAQIYKLLSHPKRLELLNILAICPATLTQLTKLVGASKANISQHLSALRSQNLVIVSDRASEAEYSIVNKDIIKPCKVFKDIFDSHQQ